MQRLVLITALILTFAPVAQSGERQYLPIPEEGTAMKYGVDVRQAMLDLEDYDREEKVHIPMRDGINLSAEIFFPKGDRENLPVILIRTPYHPDESVVPWRAQELVHFLKNGYIVVIENERGRHWSQGEFRYLIGAKADGYDSVEWVVNQPWSNGKVGTFGCSSSAEHQLGLATMNHPGHAAAIPMAPGAGIGDIGPFREQGNFYRGGVVQGLWIAWYYDKARTHRPEFPAKLTQEERVNMSRFYRIAPTMPEVDMLDVIKHLPISDMMKSIEGPASTLDDFIVRHPNDPRWKDTDFINEGDKFGPPALWMFSWYDVSLAPNIALYDYVQKNAFSKQAADNQFMVINTTDHCAQGKEKEETIVGERNMDDARYDYLKLYTDWFDHWLKGEKNGVTKRAKVQVYTMGANEWNHYSSWPVQDTKNVRYYLDSDGGANSSYGSGRLVTAPPAEDHADTFVYDPAHPVQSLGGSVCCFSELFKGGSFDQAAIELRHDVLVYTTPVLEEDVNVTGTIEVELYISSDVKDTDLTFKLVDVLPDGTAYNLDDSIQRVRYREGYDTPVFMEKGEVYKVAIGPLATSNLFKAGHRIRIEVSSSNFPRYVRNLNTGGNNFDETEWVVANNTIHHSAEYPSHITLPIVPIKK